MQAPSPSLLAALTLQNAKRLVGDRHDGSWWTLDAALWDVIWHDLNVDERAFMVSVIHAQQLRRAAA
jgi:hypothetical protein